MTSLCDPKKFTGMGRYTDPKDITACTAVCNNVCPNYADPETCATAIQHSRGLCWGFSSDGINDQTKLKECLNTILDDCKNSTSNMSQCVSNEFKCSTRSGCDKLPKDDNIACVYNNCVHKKEGFSSKNKINKTIYIILLIIVFLAIGGIVYKFRRDNIKM
jgi:hypothetical protein